MCSTVRKHKKLGKRKGIVIAAEGANDRDLNPISGETVKDFLSNDIGLDARITILDHAQREGTCRDPDNTRDRQRSVGEEMREAIVEAMIEMAFEGRELQTWCHVLFGGRRRVQQAICL